MTRQEYYDKTVAHLRKQGLRSTSEASSACVYLNKDGLKCAIGVHIPDGHPAQKHLGNVYSLSCHYPDLDDIAWPQGGLDLACALQNLHDNCFSEADAKELCESFDLKYTAPDA